MSNQRYTPEFNDEAVRQAVERDTGFGCLQKPGIWAWV